MDALSEMTHGLADGHPTETDLSDFVPSEGDLILAAMYTHDRARALAVVEPPASTALVAAVAPPMTLLDRFEQLRPGRQMLVAALGAALLVAGVGWVMSGLFGTKAATVVATAAAV
jgi:hypothetical protein